MINVNKVIKKTTIILVLLILIPFQKNYSQSNSFYIYFMQNGKRINIKEGKIELKKEPFKMYAEYIKPVNLLVSVSNKAKTYNNSKKGKLIFNLPAFQNPNKRDNFFSKKNTLIVSEDSYLIWEKEKTDEDKLLKSPKNHFIVIKNVDKIFSTKENTTTDLNNIKKKLYFVCIYAVKDKEGDYEEIQREIVKIKWVKNYYKDTKRYARKKKQDGKIKIRQAKRQLKTKQRIEKQEKRRLQKIEEHKLKKAKKEQKKIEKINKKSN